MMRLKGVRGREGQGEKGRNEGKEEGGRNEGGEGRATGMEKEKREKLVYTDDTTWCMSIVSKEESPVNS